MRDTIHVECPSCGERFVVVEPETEQEQNTAEPESGTRITAELVSWEEVGTTDPYPGSDTEIPVSQCVKAEIRIDGEVRIFNYWYTPEYSYFSYVVRAELDTGRKSHNGFVMDGGVSLTNRGVPRHSEKQWSYLTEEECRRRSTLAGLGDVVRDPKHQDKDNRYRILLNEPAQQLIEDRAVAEDLLLKLAKGLIVFKTPR